MTEPSQSDRIRLHPKQAAAYQSQNKITLCCSGIQGGKSTIGALWALSRSFQYGKEDCAVIGAPSYKILNQSTIPTWMKYAGRFGQYNKGDQEFVFPSGFKVFIRTSTDPDSIEGIQNVRWFWLDEAGKCKYQFWINAEGRCARTNAPLFLTTTPYGMNWPFKHLIQPLREGKRPDISYHEWLSVDNPSFPREEYERQRAILDPRVFRRKYMGIHERMQGLVYELADDALTEDLIVPKSVRIFAGVDWGFSEGHEFALVVRAITQDGYRFEIDEFKASGLDPTQQIMACTTKAKLYGIETFYCDPARPDMIAALNKAGCSAIGFHVGKEAFKPVIAGITKHTELIRGFKYRVLKHKCPQLIDEYDTYHWAEWDEETEPKEVPVAVNDHLMDAVRYLTVGTMNVNIKDPPRPIVSQTYPTRDIWKPTDKKRTAKSWDSY